MPKIILKGHIVVSDNDLAAVIAGMPNHIDLTRREEGCLRFDITQSSADQNVFSVYEELVDQIAFEAHQQRVQSSDWGGVASNVQRHYQVTEAD